MATILDFLVSLFEFSNIPWVNFFITAGIGYLTYKVSYLIVGIIAPILFFCGPAMSLAHWIIRIVSIIFIIHYSSKLNLFVTIPIAIVGFVCFIRKIF